MAIEIKRTEAPQNETGILGIEQFKERFDEKLTQYLKQKTKDLSEISEYSPISTYMKEIAETFGKEGKRIRPYIAYLMYSALGEKDTEKALDSLVPLEIFHEFCLIHDDIHDKGTIRHGQPTIQVSIANQLKLENPKGNADYNRIGESQAMLIGDLFSIWSQELIQSNDRLSDGEKKGMLANFHAMAQEVVLGQSIDINSPAQDSTSMDRIREKNNLKTSSYTFTRPMLIGASLIGKGNDPTVDSFCRDLGTRLGTAYQMQDDLLDLISTDTDLKKNTMSDMSQRQHTYFTQYVAERGSEEQRKEFLSLFGKPGLSQSDKENIIKILSEVGAIQEGKNIIEENIQEARTIINGSDIVNQEAKEVFSNLINSLEARSK